jgi:putative transcriptional regulator
MTAARHPSPELLARYVAGSLSPAAALVMESHLALCDDCASDERDALALGGLLLERLSPSELDARLFERTLARLDEPPATSASRYPRRSPSAPHRAGAGWDRAWPLPASTCRKIPVPISFC